MRLVVELDVGLLRHRVLPLASIRGHLVERFVRRRGSIDEALAWVIVAATASVPVEVIGIALPAQGIDIPVQCTAEVDLWGVQPGGIGPLCLSLHKTLAP
jgi:hypothetical protein